MLSHQVCVALRSLSFSAAPAESSRVRGEENRRSGEVGWLGDGGVGGGEGTADAI